MDYLKLLTNRLHLSETRKKIFTNVFWAVSGKCVNLIGTLVVGIIIARYLGPEQYGLMNYVMSYIAIFQVFADFGLDNIQIREEARTPERRDVIVGTAFGLKLIFSVIVLAAVFVTTFVSESDEMVRTYIMIYSFSVVFNSTWVFRNHFTSIVWNEYCVKTEITRTILGAMVKIVLLWLKADLIWFIASLLLDSLLLASGYTMSYSQKIESIRKCVFDKEVALVLLKQAFPLLLSCIAIVIYSRIDQIMISKMLDDTQLGLYSVAFQLTNVLINVPSIIALTISPVLVRVRNENRERYHQVSLQFFGVTFWLSMLVACIVSLASYPLVYFMYGESYIYAAGVLNIMAFRVVGDALSQTSGQLMIIEGIQKFASVRNVIAVIVCVILNYVLIGRYGIMGAAIVSVVTIVSSGFFANLLIKPYRHIFKLQIESIFFGWRYLFSLRRDIIK
ncbi:MAG: flippase [Bacteroidaceae bacterium]|nr:flippase [Bacteroidaceae bacterium]